MTRTFPEKEPWMTALTLVIGAVGAAVAILLGLPAAVLIGPAITVSLTGLIGAPLRIADPLRDLCFVVLGLGIGSGFDSSAGTALLRWPLAFFVLTIAIIVLMHLTRATLERGFDFDRKSAVLASAPGHLSFTLGLAADLQLDVGRVAVVQSIRLLALTLTVPFAALLMGVRMPTTAMPPGQPMPLVALAALAIAAVALGLVLKRFRLPAPLLLGAMAVSAISHVSGLTPGGVPAALLVPAFMVLGALIGTRFSGMSWVQFRAALLAGLTVTLIAVAIASAAALPVAAALDMPAAHVLAAFAPGGLESMIAFGAVMGASPGFVAACHVARLVVLTAIIPLLLGRVSRPS